MWELYWLHALQSLPFYSLKSAGAYVASVFLRDEGGPTDEVGAAILLRKCFSLSAGEESS